MTPKPVEMFQGSDWLTYRWTVAQAFDTLDRIRDLCLQMPMLAGHSIPSTPVASHYDVLPDDIADIFGYIVELCDDLGGEMDAVHADLYPLLRNNTAHMWLAFEMRLHLRDLRIDALKEAESGEPAVVPPDTINAHAGRIRTLLKQIDQ